MYRLSSFTFLLLALLAVSISSCVDDDDSPNNPVRNTFSTLFDSDPRFTVLNAALERTDLDDVIFNLPSANVTVFAPTDDAFAAAGITDVNAVDETYLNQLLRYHVIDGNIQPDQFNGGTDGDFDVETRSANLSGQRFSISANKAGDAITVDGITTAIERNTPETALVNGTVYVIDELLTPPSLIDRALADGRFGILAEALTRANLVPTLNEPGNGAFTVFAPTDDAFAAAGITSLDDIEEDDLSDLLLYHVLGMEVPASNIPGGFSYATTLSNSGPDDSALSTIINNVDNTVRINDEATVTATDIAGFNGIIHVIDTTLSTQTILELIAKNGDLSSLTGAVVTAELDGALGRTTAEYTVFAPTNDAFTSATDTLGPLLRVDTMTMMPINADTVAAILTYHVINSENLRSNQLGSMENNTDSIQTLSGDFLYFPTVDEALTPQTDTDTSGVRQTFNFVTTDIQGTNGVAHTIDQVLFPFRFSPLVQ